MTRALLLLLLPLSLFAQNDGDEKDTLSTKIIQSKMIVLRSNTRYSSNQFSTRDFLSLATNPTINDDLVDDLFENSMTKNNTILFNENTLDVPLPLKKGLINFTLSNNTFVYGKIDQDLLGLISKGNSYYKGSTAYISDTKITYLKQSGVSISYAKSLSTNKLFISIKPSIQVNQTSGFFNFGIENSSIFTEENGEYIDLVYNYNLAYQGDSKPFSAFGFNANLGIDVISNSGKTFFSVAIRNYGINNFANNNFYNGSKSGELTYSGKFIDYENLSSLGGTNIKTESDSLIGLIKPTDIQKSGQFQQPVTYSAYFQNLIGEKDLFGLSIYYLPTYTNEPVFNVHYSHIFSKFRAGLNIGNGAFGGIASGLFFEYNYQKLLCSTEIYGLAQMSKGVYAQSGATITIAYIL